MQAKKRLSAGKLAVGEINKREEAVLNKGGSRCDSVVYDFSTDGGAVAEYATGRIMPAGAVITEIIADELTNLTGALGATIKLKAGSTDLIAATAFASFAGLTKPALAGSAAAIKLSAASELKFEIETAALTAGKLRLHVRYVLPND